MTYVHVEQVEDMIKGWQRECADFPSIYNQGNVLRDRLDKMTADIEMPITWVDVSAWSIWKNHAIPVDVARHIAGKFNSLAASLPNQKTIDLTDEMVVAAMEHVPGCDHDDMVNALEAALAKAESRKP